jgi:hypothetical protein
MGSDGPDGGESQTFPQGHCDRAWQHALHEENVFNERLNFFLVAEAMLLVFHAEVIGKIGDDELLAIGVLGLVITFLWVIINVRQIADLEVAKRELRLCVPEQAQRMEAQKGLLRGSAGVILGYLVPLAVGSIWIALIVGDRPPAQPNQAPQQAARPNS